jgi:probable F420-dependent oxidoreductase
VKVDFFLPSAAAESAAGHAARARDLGFDTVLSAETNHDPFLALATAAAAVPGLEYGTAIAVAFARSPMVTAMTAWDLARLTGGRFLLGLGTQVRAHITRRFSMEWSAPGPRLREYVLAVRAIWEAWQHGTPLRFEGRFYRHTLMTPFFDPGPLPYPPPPVYIAGVGPYMGRVAGEVCDGLHVHPFHTVRYLDEIIRPNVARGTQAAGRRADEVALATAVMVVTGRDEAEMEHSRSAVARQIAFYASTPSYHTVLDLHGWQVGPELTRMSVRGEWEAMAQLVDDEMIDAVAVTAPIDELGDAIRRRYGDRLAHVGLYSLADDLGLTDDEWRTLVATLAAG